MYILTLETYPADLMMYYSYRLKMIIRSWVHTKKCIRLNVTENQPVI